MKSEAGLIILYPLHPAVLLMLVAPEINHEHNKRKVEVTPTAGKLPTAPCPPRRMFSRANELCEIHFFLPGAPAG